VLGVRGAHSLVRTSE
jgi:hypothetical protein